MKIFIYRWKIKGQEITGTKVSESREALAAHVAEIGGELLEILSEADKPLPPRPIDEVPLSECPPVREPVPPRPLVLVGFWKRLLADALDALFLGIAGFILAFVFHPLVSPLGENGLWLGLLIAFFYAGTLHSHIGQGQTLGKNITGIQVLRTDGSYLGLGRSYARYAVIAVLLYNGAVFSPLYAAVPALQNPAIGWIIPAMLISVFFGVSVFLAMHPLKKGFQDLLADSVVVARDSYSAEQLQAKQSPAKVKDAWTVWCLCCMLALTGLWLMADRMSADTAYAELGAFRRQIAADGYLSHVIVSEIREKFIDVRGDAVTTTSLVIRGFISRAPSGDEDPGLKEARRYAKILGTYSKIAGIDNIIIDMRTGFNIGIASLYSHDRYVFDRDAETLRERPAQSRRPPRKDT